MRRALYVAGINRKHLAEAADSCPYWLLSVSLMPRTLLDATCTRIHLLGVGDPYWFRRYPVASGDSTTWIPRFPWNRSRPPVDWLKGYGDQEIPYVPPATLQDRLAV